MTNLLPPHAKKQIVIEYWTRVICAWVMLWSLCLVVGVVLLWPTYFLLSENNAGQEQSAIAASERSSEFKDIRGELTMATKQATEISLLSNRKKLSTVMSEVWNATDQRVIVISSLSVERTVDGLQPIIVSGTAADRQSLADYRDALEAIPYVASVDLPIGNLAKREDITFTLTALISDTDL